jgi:hypothetical protein
MKYDLNLLKSRLPDYLRAIGCDLNFKHDTTFTTACPIHGGEKQNFKADQKPDGTWVWHCFSGCGGKGGDTIKLHAKLNGILSGSFESIKGTAEVLHVEPDEHHQAPRISVIERERRRREAEEEAKQEALTSHLNQQLDEKLDYFSYRHWFDDWRHALDAGTLITLKDRRQDSHLFIESLFNPDEIIWMGETYESGLEQHRQNFRPVSDWIKLDQLPPRVAAGTFQRGSISRNSESVDQAPFIVIESDELIGHQPTNPEEREMNKAASFALFFFCIEKLGLHPRAVIDTGNKSLHLWFDRPPPDEFSALLKLADGLRIDKGLLERCQSSPLRLPGTIHEKTNNAAELYFINPK